MIIAQRRMKGAMTITASLNYIDEDSEEVDNWIVGSLECSTHEVSLFFFYQKIYLIYDGMEMYQCIMCIIHNMLFMWKILGRCCICFHNHYCIDDIDDDNNNVDDGCCNIFFGTCAIIYSPNLSFFLSYLLIYLLSCPLLFDTTL